MTTIGDQLGALAESMANAAMGVLKKQGPEVRDTAKAEFTKLLQTTAFIEAGVLKGTITQDNAHAMFDAQKQTAQMILWTVEELTLQLVQDAINAALAVVKSTINKAVGFALI